MFAWESFSLGWEVRVSDESRIISCETPLNFVFAL